MEIIKKLVRYIILATAGFVTTTAYTQSATLHSRINSINAIMSDAYGSKSAETLLQYYAPDAVCMPEYYPTLRGSSFIRQYFQQWFEATKLVELNRTIYEVQQLGDHAIETGTFSHRFIKTNGDSLSYNGKYLRCWNLNKDGKLFIMSEIWGGIDYTDRMIFPTIKMALPSQVPVTITSALAKELRARNDYITRLVKERKGPEHATVFTDDAIYMPYYKPIHIGINSIRSYFAEHEKPGDVNIDSLKINASSLSDWGDYVAELGYYGVRWRANDNTSGLVTGKSINIWKRNKEGVLMLYRQMVNHD